MCVCVSVLLNAFLRLSQVDVRVEHTSKQTKQINKHHADPETRGRAGGNGNTKDTDEQNP